jgi:hypothetical protein
LLRDQQQWLFAESREARLDELVVLMDSQLDAEDGLIHAGDAVRFDAAQYPEVANVLEQGGCGCGPGGGQVLGTREMVLGEAARIERRAL